MKRVLNKIRLIENELYLLAKVVGGSECDPGQYFHDMEKDEISSHIYDIGKGWP